MRWIVTAGVCALVGSVSYAQQDPQFTQYMFDRLSVNSAVAGGTGNICATALLRQQWTGFDGAPKTGLINLQGPINKINSGVGLSVYYDKLGQERSTIVRLHYAYHLKVGAQSTLSAGFYVGMSGRALDSKWIAIDRLPMKASPAAPGGDELLSSRNSEAGKTSVVWRGDRFNPSSGPISVER